MSRCSGTKATSTTTTAAASTAELCAVCFDPVVQGATLPCACTAVYCGTCWDRALAHSLNACGTPRCPTCRCPVRADFDSVSGLLVFSREVQEAPVEYDGHIMDVEDIDVASLSEDDEALLAGLAAVATEDMDEEREEDVPHSGSDSSPAARRAVRPRRDGEGGAAGDGRETPRRVARRTGRIGDGGQAPSRLRSVREARRWAASSGSFEHLRSTQRLVRQARPAQLSLLRRHGVANPELRAAAAGASVALAAVAAVAPAAGTLMCTSFPVRRAAADAALQALAAASAAAATAAPCVCGAKLGHVSYRERLVRCLRMRTPPSLSFADFEATVERVLERREPCYFCDLCGESRAEGGVWTCENGNNTILHANAYDVCEKCFALYCSGGGDGS